MDNLGRKRRASYSTDGLAAVVGEVKLMLICASLELVEDVISQEISGWDGRVVDLGDVNIIVDRVGVLISVVSTAKGGFHNREEGRVEVLCEGERAGVVI